MILERRPRGWADVDGRMGGATAKRQKTGDGDGREGAMPLRGGESVPGREIPERLQGAEEKVSVAREESGRKELHRCAGRKGREVSGPFRALLHSALWLYIK